MEDEELEEETPQENYKLIEVSSLAVAQPKKEGDPLPPLSKEQEVAIFKSLAHKSMKNVGKDFGFHFYYDTDQKIVRAIQTVSNKVKKAPELYGISEDVVDIVDEAMSKRSIRKNPLARADMALEAELFRDKLDAVRDKAADMLLMKLSKFDKKTTIDGISIRDLKDVLAMAVDKSRLMKGESTENIVKLSKVDTDNMTPEDALKVIMKAREMIVESNK